MNLQAYNRGRFNPLKNRTLIYIFSIIMIIGYVLDIIFLDFTLPVYILNVINIIASFVVILLFILKKISIKYIVQIQIIGLLLNLLLSDLFYTVKDPEFTNMFLRNALILFMFIPVYGLYCGKKSIFHIVITYLALYTMVLFRTDYQFLVNNAPILIFSAVIYHIAIYYIFSTIEKMQTSQDMLNEDLNSQKELLISRNKDLEEKNEQIYHQTEKLKELLATRDKLFSIIAHDLRSPFTIIIGFSELMMNRWDVMDITETKNHAKTINEHAKNTYNILENLLNWAGSQTGQISFNPEYFNLKAAFIETKKCFEISILEKKITIEIEIDDDLEIFADKNMFMIIIRNIISNSIKFSRIQGIIKVTIIKRAKEIEITVSDNGVGFDKEKQNRLFVFGATQTTAGTANEKGCGLGLIICKEFIEKHGGKIWVESEENIGSQFKFTLPLSINLES